jgi:dTDP-4-dehydrorhamnose reductase
MKILVLGVTGMLGNTVFRYCFQDTTLKVIGTLRSAAGRQHFTGSQQSQLIDGVDILDLKALATVLNQVKPDIVINCVGLIKQYAISKDPLVVLPLNAMFPHQLSRLCEEKGARLVHISTDCVFSGRTGLYKEDDISDAEDLYGKSKYIGELHEQSHAITLRTSIIGHELNSHESLVEWFLSQSSPIKGYERVIFSGLPTVELARIIKDFLLPNPKLHGLYHVSAAPIDKYQLLRLIGSTYNKKIEITPDQEICINRSLDSKKFQQDSGYTPPAWPNLIRFMHEFH